MKNELHDVSVQRDELRLCLEELCDKIRHGAYNHMFKESNPRAHNNDDKPCEKGHKRFEVIWCQGRCCGDCDGCAKNCPISFEEKRLFDAMKDAQSVLDQPDSEMPSVEPKDFPVYDPNREYKATDRWIARSFYRFAVGYWLFSCHDDMESESRWERALDDLLAISLDAIGKDGNSVRTFFRSVREIESKATDREFLKSEAKKLAKTHPEAVKLFEEAVDFIYDKGNERGTVRRLVFSALTIRSEYNFGHKYPGSDMGVYGDAFCGLIDIALKLVGLESDNEPWPCDGESKAEYAKRLAEAKATQKEKIYAFMSETDGLCC